MPARLSVPLLLVTASLILAGGDAPKAASPSDGLETRPTNPTTTVELNGQTFTLPAGFTIELAAGPPLVERPVTIDFDDAGRLYVGESSGTNEDVHKQLAKKPHRILRLEDSTGTGKLDKKTVFADKMMLPEGTMWLQGSLYVAAPPSIWKLTDTKNSGVADERTEWFKGKTLTHCANDLHGPHLGPDGWIYWGKGAFAQQSYDRPGESPLVTKAAHVFRCRPDGTGLEPVLTGGMDNPIDVAFTPGGEPIVSSTFVQNPAGGKRDGLLHAVHGGLYGKDHAAVLKDHVWTSPHLMPVMTHLGPAAVSGIARYESAVFGDDYKDNVFAALFNMQKVTRHVLVPDGATFRTIDTDFVVSSHKEFHPTDVVEDADGSLLIVDTGGWYKICCPTSQLVRPDKLGAIYRVRKVNAPKIVDPRSNKLEWAKATPDELAKRLDDPRPYVRRRAKESLADRGKDALPALKEILRKAPSDLARLEAVWTLIRIDDPLARKLNRLALKSTDDVARQAALHAVGRWKDDQAVSQVLAILKNGSPHNRRAAAEAVGRMFHAGTKDREAREQTLKRFANDDADHDRILADKMLRIRRGETLDLSTDVDKFVLAALPLREALTTPTDRVLHHSLTYALFEVADPLLPAWLISAGIPKQPGDSALRRAGLMALEADADPKWRDRVVRALPSLACDDPDLKATLHWIVGRHPEWGKQLAEQFKSRLAVKLTASDRQELIGQLASLAKSPEIQSLLGDLVRAKDADVRRLALASMAKASLKTPPAAWFAVVADALGEPDVQLEAIAAARSFHLKPTAPAALTKSLVKIADDPTAPPLARLAAAAALPGGSFELSTDLFVMFLVNLQPDQPLERRSLAIESLGRWKLSNAQLASLAKVIPSANALDVDRLLDLYVGCKDDAVGERLLTSLETPKLKNMLRVDGLKRNLKNFGPPVQKRAEALYAAIDAEAAKQRQRLEAMLEELPKGDVRRGHEVFNRPKNACTACHAIGYLGGKVGPDLTRIGAVRTNRDLLEAIVYPSASLVRGYEPLLVVTKDGKAHNGLVREETPDEIALATGPNQDVRISRKDIEEMQPSRVSIMPAGLDQQLSRQELADLIAFLQGCK